MDKSSTLDCYLYFMWNRWNEEECKGIFGDGMGEKIWSKWEARARQCGLTAAPAQLYADLSGSNRKLIVKHAVKYYNE